MTTPPKTVSLREAIRAAGQEALSQVGMRERILLQSLLPLAERELAKYTDAQLEQKCREAYGMLGQYLTAAGIL